MAYVLRLHENAVGVDPILKEVKCRIWWSLFMADRWCPPGLGLPREIMKIDRTLDLPMDEVSFQMMDESTGNFDRGELDGIWKYMITLVDILGPIQDLNTALLPGDLELSDIEMQVDSLSQRLGIWHSTLPRHMTMNDENWEAHRAKGQGGTFVALHLGYHHYSTLLLFQYLDATPSSSLETTYRSERCRFHALSFSRLVHRARIERDFHVVYLTVAHMTMVSSSVLLHMLLFGDESEIEEARKQLTYNFEALVELRKYWVHVDAVIQRLLMFQEECLQASNMNTHRVDRWMVRFLLEYALPLTKEDHTRVNATIPRHPIPEILWGRTAILSEVFESWWEGPPFMRDQG